MTIEIGRPTTEQIPFNLDSWEPEKVWRAGVTSGNVRTTLGCFISEVAAKHARQVALESGYRADLDDVCHISLPDAMARARAEGASWLVLCDECLRVVQRFAL